MVKMVPRRSSRYIDGPVLRYALWRRIRGRLLLLSFTLAMIGVWIAGPALIGFPHVILVILSIPVLAMALVGLPHLLRDPLVRTIMVRAASTRQREPSMPALPPAVSSDEFRATFELVVGVGFTAGNQVDVLTNGDGTFERLWCDLRAARRSITVQMYYAGPGLVADTTIGLLAARAKAGVDVYFLYDAFGAADLPKQYIDALDEAGVHTAAYRPVRWYALDNAAHRLHVRGLVIDGRVGYTGGFGIDDKWLGDGRSPGEWRDTNVRFVGPAVAQLQAGFVAAWSTATGAVLIGDFLMGTGDAPDSAAQRSPQSDPLARQTDLAAVVRSPPLMGSTAAERLIALAIASATRTLFVSNSYFVPTPGFVTLLREAADRGVDVRILTNGRQSDVRTTWLAGRRTYEALLGAGVRIYEYHTTIHAKTFVVDGRLSSVSTMNFDNRSLAYNNEVALVTLDAGIGQYMDSLFLADASYSDEIVLGTFQTRAWTSRVMERLASIGSRLL
jgi:cardiolipin synthase